MRINIDAVAAFVRGGSTHLVERLRTAAVNRLTKLKVPVEGKVFRGKAKTLNYNEAAVMKWIEWVDKTPEKAEALKLLQRLAVSANKRLDG